jgi:orotidine-5'-phosphate decarboxylase
MPCDLILVLDAPSTRELTPVLRRLAGTVRWAKVGLELFTAEGPDSVRAVADLGFRVFLDLKLHDIPNTVAKAVESASRLPIGMLTLHAAGGRRMMAAAAEARRGASPDLLLLAVTVLTSLGESDLADIGVAGAPVEQVLRLGRLAVESGLSGLVCSPVELPRLRAQLPGNLQLVTPGIRPAGSPGDDQKRVMTPAAAARAGANYIVVGRPILQAADPAEAALAILAELNAQR